MKLIDELWDMGVVVVAAAGNYGPAPFSVTVPGISRKIITVGSFDDIRSGKGPTDCCIVTVSYTHLQFKKGLCN